MRFHCTSAFSEVKARYDSALREYSTFDDTGEGAEEREAAASKRLGVADPAFFNFEAITPMELLAKISASFARDPAIDNGLITMSSIRDDLHRMQRHAPSQPIQERFDAWREGEIRIDQAKDQDDIDAASEASIELYEALAKTACTTPGDFIIKQYVRLRGTNGHCSTNSTKRDGTPNLWDIWIDDNEHEASLDLIDKHTTYRDISDTDVGRNLLAYGLTDFDAMAWLEVADRIGFQVGLLQQQDGSWSFGWPCTNTGIPGTRLRRERDRLMEIVNFPFDGDNTRFSALADEIRLRWPQLMHANPLAPAEEMEAA